jgi:hypothetical protein
LSNPTKGRGAKCIPIAYYRLHLRLLAIRIIINGEALESCRGGPVFLVSQHFFPSIIVNKDLCQYVNVFLRYHTRNEIFFGNPVDKQDCQLWHHEQMCGTWFESRLQLIDDTQGIQYRLLNSPPSRGTGFSPLRQGD